MRIQINKGHVVRFRAALSPEDPPKNYVVKISCEQLDTNNEQDHYGPTDLIIARIFTMEALMRVLTAEDGPHSQMHIFDSVSLEYFEEVTTTAVEDFGNIAIPSPPEEPNE